MSTEKIWTCALGLHRFRLVNDDNPENRRSKHKECTRCGQVRDIKEYGTTDGRYLGGIPTEPD